MIALAVLIAAPNARATIDFYVNSSGDASAGGAPGVCQTTPMNSVCTLRAAVEAATAVMRQPGEEVVIHVPSNTYTFTIAHSVDVSGFTTILGAGAATTIVDANHLSRAFLVKSGSVAKISGLAIRNGVGITGGCVAQNISGSVLTIEDSIVEYCSATGQGGGVTSGAGALHMTRSTVRHCMARWALHVRSRDVEQRDLRPELRRPR